jgi:virginiamycin A acetyltransferase
MDSLSLGSLTEFIAMKHWLKMGLRFVTVILMFPLAVMAGFGRLREMYTMFAHTLALVPGLPGVYLRGAYYFLTLRKCSLETAIGFGSYFAHPQASVARGVGTGAYCVIGTANIGARVRIASGVQILSGQHQHPRDAQGHFTGHQLSEVTIGEGAWLGAACIIMENVGAGALIGAGAVVGTPVPPGATASGNPARIIRVNT